MRRGWGVIWAVLGILLTGNTLYAASLRITRMAIDDETLYMSVESSVTDAVNLVKIVNDGISVEFKYTIWVYRQMGLLLPNELLLKRTVIVSVKRDFVNDGYEILMLDGSSKKFYWISGLYRLYDKLMKVDSIFLLDLSQLDESSEYFAEVQLEVSSLKLYPPLSIIYNLFGNWNWTSKKIRSRIFNRDGFITE